MATRTIPRLTEEEYLALDRANPYRSEYIDGEMLAMSFGSLRHAALISACICELRDRLTGRGSTVFASQARVKTNHTGSYVYPDISVVCGEIRTQANALDVLINPMLIVEVLSPSTRSYDQGRKFELYREIPSLSDYLLIHVDSSKIGHHSRQPDNSWTFLELEGVDRSLAIPSLSITLDLVKIYQDAMRVPA